MPLPKNIHAMIRSAFMFTLLNITGLCLYAQTGLASKEEAIAHADQVMALFEDFEIEAAFDKLRKYYPVEELDYNNLKTTTLNNLRAAVRGYGDVTHVVFIKEENLKDLALRRHYVLALESLLLRFSIVYYNSVDGWIVNSFMWNDNFEEFFE
jgi:hypothetical protein